MSREVKFADEARQKMKSGMDQVAEAVRVTMGPKGRNVAIDRNDRAPLITNDGVTIAKKIDPIDAYERMGAKLLIEVASKTNDIAGDGTTTATVLGHKMVEEGLKNIVAGANPIAVRDGILGATKAAVEEIMKIAKKVETQDEIAQVASISAADLGVGRLIADAMSEVGKNGLITIEESKSFDTVLDITKGLQIEKGYLSPYMVNNEERMEVVFERPIIFMANEKMSAVQDFIPVLESMISSGRPILFVVEDMDGPLLQTLILNKVQGKFQSAVIKAPSYGMMRKDQLEDLAILVGGEVFSKEKGMTYENLPLETMLGQAERVIITKDTTTFVNGAVDKERFEKRVLQIQNQIDTAENELDKENFEERMAKFSGGVAVIKVGGVSETEMTEKKLRIEDALNATRAAVEEGIVAGGGTALLQAQKAVHAYIDTLNPSEEDKKTGAQIVLRSMTAPAKQIAENAGINGDVAITFVRFENDDEEYGLNASTGEYVNMIEAGIIDPAKVTRSALQHAASVASTFLTTQAAIIDIKSDEPSYAKGNEWV